MAGLVCFLCAGVTWRRRAMAGGLQGALTMASAGLWAFFYAFELAVPTLGAKIVWAKLEYLGIAALPLTWFLFAVSYTGVISRLRARWIAALALIPAVTVVLAATNELHGLMWREVSLETAGSFLDLGVSYGSWFWVWWISAYVLLAAGSIMLIRAVWRYPGLYRQQTALVMIAAAAPWIANALYVARALPLGGFDPTPLSFAFTALIITLNMSRFRLYSVQPALLPAARHQLLMEMKDAVLVTDLHGRVVTANPAASLMLDSPASLLAGKKAVELLGCDIAGLPQEPDCGGEKRFELTLGGDHSARFYDVVASPVAHARWGRCAGMGNLLVFRDITERKLGEAALRASEEQLRQSQKMESVGRLAGGVAHDFNNTLAVILGNVDVALRQLEPEHQVYQDLLEIREAAVRSAGITQQLLGFARKQVVAPRRLALNKAVDSMLGMIRRLLGANIDLVWSPADDLGLVEMDPSQLDQIIINLCVNARDAIGTAGQVTIETAAVRFDDALCAEHEGSSPEDYARLTVRDTGAGMQPETLEHLFEPFFTTKQDGQGTGLGMATVYGIVKQNRGYIEVASEPDRGTRIDIYLPQSAAGTRTEKRTAALSAHATGAEVVLLVEDEPQLLRLCTRVLTGLGYQVLSAGTPAEALHVSEEHAGDIGLVITDIAMAEMSGRDLVERLTASRPGLKALFMSGHMAGPLSSRAALEKEAHFLQKPFTPDELGRAVRATLDGYPMVA